MTIYIVEDFEGAVAHPVNLRAVYAFKTEAEARHKADDLKAFHEEIHKRTHVIAVARADAPIVVGRVIANKA